MLRLLDVEDLLNCNEKPIYLFPEKALRGFCPNIHIHDSVSDLFILGIGPQIGPVAEKADQSWEYKNRSQSHECGNWE
jgi:hypothetical protein